jgi:hypothetical protein
MLKSSVPVGTRRRPQECELNLFFFLSPPHEACIPLNSFQIGSFPGARPCCYSCALFRCLSSFTHQYLFTQYTTGVVAEDLTCSRPGYARLMEHHYRGVRLLRPIDILSVFVGAAWRPSGESNVILIKLFYPPTSFSLKI